MGSHPLRKHVGYPINGILRKGPPFLFYYLTRRCNSHCVYCRPPDAPMPPDADPAAVVENLRQAREMGTTHLVLTGGEPLLYKDLRVVLQAARDLGCHVTLTTNGLSYRERAGELAGLIDNLEFSLSTADPEAYALERGVDGFQRVIDAIRVAVSLGEGPVVSATVTDENLEGIGLLAALTQGLGVMLLLKPCFRYFENRSLGTQGAKGLRRWGRAPNVWYNKAFLDFFISGGNRTAAPRCRALASTIAISPGNGIYLPCFHRSQEELPLGGGLRKALRSPEFAAHRKARGSWSFCEGCGIICYFEDAFLWPLGRLFPKDVVSRIRWLQRWLRYH